MGVNRAPGVPRAQPVVSSAIALMSGFVLACPPAAVHLLVRGDPQWTNYALLWLLAAVSPVVAVGVVRWFARTRAPLPTRWVHARAAGLLLFHVVTGLYALNHNGSGPLPGAVALVAVSFVALVGWVVSWKIVDLGRPAYRPPHVHVHAPCRTTVTVTRTATTKPKREPEPRPGDIFWADVPLDDGSGDRRRPCVVVRSYRSHAYVLGISHARRGDTVRLTPDGWSYDRRPSHVQLDPLHKLPYNRFAGRMGRCPADAWNEILYGYPPHGDPTTPRRRRPEPVREQPPPRQSAPSQASSQAPPRQAPRQAPPRQPAAPQPPSDGRPRRLATDGGAGDPGPRRTTDGVARRRD